MTTKGRRRRKKASSHNITQIEVSITKIVLCYKSEKQCQLFLHIYNYNKKIVHNTNVIKY